jgi:hypothetical protein
VDGAASTQSCDTHADDRFSFFEVKYQCFSDGALVWIAMKIQEKDDVRKKP